MSDLGLAEQRDRFLTFAFAASDVLIEIDDSGRICFVVGSVRSLFSKSSEELTGELIIDFAHPDQRIAFSEFLNKLMCVGRARDFVTELIGEGGKPHHVCVSGMASTQQPGVFHLTFGHAPFIARLAVASRKSGVVSAQDFTERAEQTIAVAKETDDVLNFAMFDVDMSKAESEGLSKEDSEKVSSDLEQTIQAWSADGNVGEISKGKYSVLLEGGVEVSEVSDRLKHVAQSAVPDVELEIAESTIVMEDLIDTDDLGDMLDCAMERFDESGAENFNLGSIDDTISALRNTGHPARDTGGNARPTLKRAHRRGTVEGWG